MSETSDSQYRVGYKNPPRHTQFKKGQSGNPSGSKGIKSLSRLIREALNARVKIEVKGRRKRVTKLEAAIGKLVDRATEGDSKIFQVLTAEFQRFEPFEEKPPVEVLDEHDKTVMDALYSRLYRHARAEVLAEMKAAEAAKEKAAAEGEAGNSPASQ